jgi:hypothetical protein
MHFSSGACFRHAHIAHTRTTRRRENAARARGILGGRVSDYLERARCARRVGEGV